VKSNLIAGVVALSAAFALTACGQEKPAAPAAAPKTDGPPTVGLVMKSLSNEYFQQMQQGAVAHVAQRNNDVKLLSGGIQNETDVDGQVALIDNYITQRVNAIVLAPADSKALVQSVKKATDAGIKVVNIDVKLDDGALKQAGLDIPFVAPDNQAAALESGLVLAKALSKGDGCVILEGNPGADNATQRANGFKAAVQQSGLTLVASQTAHWETAEANSVFGNILTANPGVKCLMASNDNMALGALKVIEERGADVKVASFDNLPAIKPYIVSGKVVATVEQHGSEQAGFGIDCAMTLLAGQQCTGWQRTPTEVITKDNVG
jgi:ribose transport system substrate-binding protein